MLAVIFTHTGSPVFTSPCPIRKQTEGGWVVGCFIANTKSQEPLSEFTQNIKHGIVSVNYLLLTVFSVRQIRRILKAAGVGMHNDTPLADVVSAIQVSFRWCYHNDCMHVIASVMF